MVVTAVDRDLLGIHGHFSYELPAAVVTFTKLGPSRSQVRAGLMGPHPSERSYWQLIGSLKKRVLFYLQWYYHYQVAHAPGNSLTPVLMKEPYLNSGEKTQRNKTTYR